MGAISKLAPSDREIACWERRTEILMVPLRECSDCDQVGTVAGMSDEEIRQAGAADVAAVKAVTDAAYHHYIERIGQVPQPMERDHAACVAAGQVYVTGEPVRGLVVVEERGDHLYLDNIAVHPDAQGTGVGRRLLHFVDAHARARGLPEVRLYTNALMWENQKIYPRYGYEFVERRVDGPYDRVHYRKRLV
jgi:ribosomal protein S18 acetylase RimI-like enzyme